jgi:hypothetical protein
MPIYNVNNIETVTEYQHNDNITYSINVKTFDGQSMCVPPDPANADYQLVQQWIADGGVPIIVNN